MGVGLMLFSTQLQHIKKLKSGFTLMELIVSIAVFSIIALAAVDVMVSVFRAQAKAIALKDVLDNARFSLELMSREIRTGNNMVYTTIPPPNCPRNGLRFTSYNQGSPQERFYYWEDTGTDAIFDAIMRVAMPIAGSIDCSVVVPQQFTSEEIIVERMAVILSGNFVGPTDGQPRVTIGFTMRSRDPRFAQSTVIRLGTTITQRLRDL
jgi:prepilin-type N-terminal cleavage/methylation domain-containing protein